jgi:hypothetical protein
MRAKTSIEIAKEEAATGASGVQGKAPAPKAKSRILQPGTHPCPTRFRPITIFTNSERGAAARRVDAPPWRPCPLRL